MAGSEREQACASLGRATDLVARRWTMVIVDQLRTGPKRYTQLEGACSGISPRTLSTRLHEMRDAGLVTREQYAESPPRVEYELTELGRELVPAVEALRVFGGLLLEREQLAAS